MENQKIYLATAASLHFPVYQISGNELKAFGDVL
jgi:hypothetical protein